jgi:hypothetical protein
MYVLFNDTRYFALEALPVQLYYIAEPLIRDLRPIHDLTKWIWLYITTGSACSKEPTWTIPLDSALFPADAMAVSGHGSMGLSKRLQTERTD